MSSQFHPTIGPVTLWRAALAFLFFVGLGCYGLGNPTGKMIAFDYLLDEVPPFHYYDGNLSYFGVFIMLAAANPVFTFVRLNRIPRWMFWVAGPLWSYSLAYTAWRWSEAIPYRTLDLLLSWPCYLYALGWLVMVLYQSQLDEDAQFGNTGGSA